MKLARSLVLVIVLTSVAACETGHIVGPVETQEDGTQHGSGGE